MTGPRNFWHPQTRLLGFLLNFKEYRSHHEVATNLSKTVMRPPGRPGRANNFLTWFLWTLYSLPVVFMNR